MKKKKYKKKVEELRRVIAAMTPYMLYIPARAQEKLAKRIDEIAEEYGTK